MTKKLDLTGIDEIANQDLVKESKAIESITGPLTQEEIESASKAIEMEEKYGDLPLESAALGAARVLSFGLSDQALIKSGIYTQEELRELKKRNEIASLTGEAGATAAAILASGGTGAIAKGVGAAGKGVQAASKAGLLAEKAFISALAKEGKKSIAKEIVRKAGSKMIGSAVEGAAYGAGQLISENALGNAEINAENILATVGTGALLGGATAGVFEVPKALVPVSKKAGKAVASKAIQNPTDAAMDIYGLTPSSRLKLKNRQAQFVEDLPEWTVKKAKLGYFTDNKTLGANISNIKKSSGENIGNIMQKIDDVAATNPSTLPSKMQVYGNIAKKIDEDIIQEYANVPGFREQLTPVMKIVDEYVELAKKGGNLKASEIHELRQKVDKLIKFDKSPGTYTLKEKALNDVRFLLNDEIQNIAKNLQTTDTQKMFGNLAEDLLQANKDYSYASRLLPLMEQKIEKEAAKRSIFNLSDLVLGGAAMDVVKGLGGLAVGSKKLLESDFRRRVTILSAIEKQNKAVDNKVSSSIKEFFGTAKKAAPKAEKAIKSSSTRALINSNLSIPLEDKKKKPSNRKEAFKNVSNNINELMADPEKLQKTITRRTIHLNNIAPETTNAAVVTAVKGLQFLNSKMPKPTTDVSSSNLFTKREFEPSELQLSKFERYVQAVENPMSAVDDLKNGTLTREAAEAIQVVYPNLFAKMQEQVIETVQDPNVKVDYNKRLQLGILMDIPTDSSLMPANIANLQNNIMFQEAEQPSSATAAKAENISIADRRETKANKIAQK